MVVSSKAMVRGAALFLCLLGGSVTILFGCRDEGADACAFFEATIQFDDRMVVWDQQDPTTLTLLERFRPHIFVAPGSYRPLNFYDDYLPNCEWRGTKMDDLQLGLAPDRDALQRVKKEKNVYLDYKIAAKDALRFTEEHVQATGYGRVYEVEIELGSDMRRFLFLKYSFVFPYSGLPAGAGWVKRTGSNLLGDAEAWHELDIHGAIHVILDAEDQNRPMGVLLAQHNHHTVHWVGEEWAWPANDRISISFSKLSNEPYLMPVGKDMVQRRVVGDPTDIEYLVGRVSKAPIGSGLDEVYSEAAGSTEVQYELELLPLDDALYTAWIPLGDRQKMLGVWRTWYRAGPPGMDFYALPGMANLVDLTAMWDIDAEDDRFFALFATHVRGMDDYELEPVLQHQRDRLTQNLLLHEAEDS